jgi:inner membrane protein
MSNNNFHPTFWDRNRILIKGFIIGFLILLMLIPAFFVSNLVYERQSRQTEVINEVSSKWAEQQTVTGPILVLPYKEYNKTPAGAIEETRRTAYLLPEVLNVNGHMQPEIRHRSIFDVILYRSDIELRGSFNFQTLEKLEIPAQNIMWQEARLEIGVNDIRGPEDEIQLNWNGTNEQFEPGTPETTVLKQGLNAPVTADLQNKPNFNIHINLRGSGYLYFTPVGKTTEVTLNAPWKDPAFDGAYLPYQTPAITDKGFTAKWKVLQSSRQYPQCWVDKDPGIDQSAFGVKLLQPVDGYSKTQRTSKYAILFIALTFTIFFFLEVIQNKMVHPLQYVLVGLALCIFYTLLLSISEYTGFNIAYSIASVATVLLIGLYVGSVFKDRKTSVVFTLALGGLYAYIFILIQLQDYALLFGSIGLFLIIAAMMYYSRKIDWYGSHRKTENDIYNESEQTNDNPLQA